MNAIRLDCAIGGGQVLRTGLALATVLKKRVEFENIRANRPKPGLQAQHLAGVRALEQMGGKAEGAQTGSQKISYTPPEKIDFEKISLDIGTAGSVTLVMQTLLLPLAFSGEKRTVELMGGTHVAWSPPFEYFEKVFIPAAAKFGIRAECSLKKYGFYPQGGGIAEIIVHPCGALRPAEFLERGELKSIEGVSAAANLPAEIAERQKKSALKQLVAQDISPKIKVESVNAEGQGTFVFLQANYGNSIAGFSALGEKGKPAEKVGEEVAQKFLEFNNSAEAVDEHLGDQLIPLMALAEGKSAIRTKKTEHLLANIAVCEKLLDVRFTVDGSIITKT
ncbi:RNA 3'-phosphate cyclase [Candidatus Micrarchaeota archaeon]|nr:RNA 3'-phosphate cyclase [Candidatus Micrarchaeota archaeon]